MKKYLITSFLLIYMLGLSACTWPNDRTNSNDNTSGDHTETTAGAGDTSRSEDPSGSGDSTGTAIGR